MHLHSTLAAVMLFIAALVAPLSVSAGDRLAGYKPVDLASWQPRTSSSVLALVEPLYRDHPEAVEGRPTLRIDLRGDNAGGLVIDIDLNGFLDDSVAGAQYRAFVVETEQGWRLDALGERNICARGATAGVPSIENCP